MQSLAPYIRQAYHSPGSLYMPPSANDQIFGHPESAPQLVRNRTNRIIVYPGSFNPPHRGHLHLLNHTFHHGVYDLNVVAAIVLPSSEEALSHKCGKKSLTFQFGRQERCYLWKKDPQFPEWAWVFETTKAAARNALSQKFRNFVHNLKAATSRDGYEIELVYLYGPDRMTTKSSYDICQLTLLCDAARTADYQRSCGRLSNFQNFTKWKRAKTDKGQLEILLRARAQLGLAALQTTRPDVAQKTIEDCPDYVDKTTQARVTAALRDLRDVVCCKDIANGTRTLRFIKYKGDGPCRGHSESADKGTVATKSSKKRKEINSTKLRDGMRTKQLDKLRACLYRNALSPGILWWYAPDWLQEARNGSDGGITFLRSNSPRREPRCIVQPRSRARPFSIPLPGENSTPLYPEARRKRSASI